MLLTWGEVKDFAEHAGLKDTDTLGVIATSQGFQMLESMMIAQTQESENTLVFSTYDWREE